MSFGIPTAREQHTGWTSLPNKPLIRALPTRRNGPRRRPPAAWPARDAKPGAAAGPGRDPGELGRTAGGRADRRDGTHSRRAAAWCPDGGEEHAAPSPAAGRMVTPQAAGHRQAKVHGGRPSRKRRAAAERRRTTGSDHSSVRPGGGRSQGLSMAHHSRTGAGPAAGPSGPRENLQGDGQRKGRDRAAHTQSLAPAAWRSARAGPATHPAASADPGRQRPHGPLCEDRTTEEPDHAGPRPQQTHLASDSLGDLDQLKRLPLPPRQQPLPAPGHAGKPHAAATTSTSARTLSPPCPKPSAG